MKQLDCFVERYVKNGYIPEDQAPWLRYALEKRITSIITLIPVIMIGLAITSQARLFAFLVAFFWLRSRTNGYHAKSVAACTFGSVVWEIFFLKVLPVRNTVFALVSFSMSIFIIWFCAPYNHPDMGMSLEEVIACAKSAKVRLSMLVFSFCILNIWGLKQVAEGILLGIVMTAATLIMAKVMSKQDEKSNHKAKNGRIGAHKMILLIITATLVGALRNHIVPVIVNGNSMYPTLTDGSLLLTNRIHTSAKHGDLIVVQTTDKNSKSVLIIKRVIGVGGETIKIDYESNTVCVNGHPIDEPYINQAEADPLVQMQREKIVEYIVPVGSVFVMGDNRNHSQDSRDPQIGFVSQGNIFGTIISFI